MPFTLITEKRKKRTEKQEKREKPEGDSKMKPRRKGRL